MDDGREDDFEEIKTSVEFKITERRKNSVDVDMFNDIGMTSLMHFAREGNLSIVKSLVENKASINILSACEPNYTALMYAVDKGHAPVVEYLLSCNAKFNIRNKEGTTARKLIKDEKIKEKFRIYDQRLLNAVTMNKVDLVRLLALGLDSDGLNVLSEIVGKTPLILATEMGLIDIVKVLIQAQADLNVISFGGAGYSALMIAAEKGSDVLYYQIAELLLKHKVNTSITNSEGETALSVAKKHGEKSAIYKLIYKYVVQNSSSVSSTMNFLTSWVPTVVFSGEGPKNEKVSPNLNLSNSRKFAIN